MVVKKKMKAKKVKKVRRVKRLTPGEYAHQAMKEYGTYVNEDRATADARDGLKPVQRRILFSAYKIGALAKKGHVKCARVVGDTVGKYHPHGDCLRGNTLVYGLDGKTRRIKDLVGKELWVLAHDPKSGCTVPVKAHSFRIGQRTDRLFKVNLSDGSSVTCTANHLFRSKKDGWVKAENLEYGNVLVGGELYLGSKKGDRPWVGIAGLKRDPVQYIAGSAVSGHKPSKVIHHQISTRNNKPENLRWMTRENHAKHHGTEENQLAGLESGRYRMFHGDMREVIKEKNSQIMKAYNKVSGLKKAKRVLELIRDDGEEPTKELYEEYRTEIYNAPIIERMISREQITSFEQLLSLNVQVDTSAAVGLTAEFHEDERKGGGSSVEAVKSRVHQTIAIVLEVMLSEFGDLRWSHYEEARNILIQRNGLGYGYIEGRTWPKKSTSKKQCGNIRRLARELSPRHLLFVTEVVEIKKSRKVPMYDFTVDGYENMLVVSDLDDDGEYGTLVCVHNSAVYGTLVNMTHAHTALMDGHGNFGSPTKPEFAAMRYTETRLSKLGVTMFDDSAIMEMQENYDGKDQEPVVLPARVPVLLLNGSEGIGVGVSANIPPNNLCELYDAIELLMEDSESEEIFDVVKGPDYGHGILISSKSEIKRAYMDGKGSLRFRCVYHYEIRDNVNELIITDFAPRFNFRQFIDRAKILMDEGVIDYVANNTSHKTGLRICVGFRSPKLLKERFLKLLRVSASWHFNALRDHTFRRYNLRGLLLDFIEFRQDIEEKVLSHQMGQAVSKLSREYAKLAASKNMDALIKVLKRKNLDDDALATAVTKALNLDEWDQAVYILGCQIRSLSRMNLGKVNQAIKDLKARIKEIKADLEDIDAVVLRRLKEMVDKFGTKRGTKITNKEPVVAESVGSIYVGVTEGGGFNKFTTFPRSNKQHFDFMSVTDDIVTIVCKNGKARVIEVQTQKRGGLKIGRSPIKGVVPSTRRFMIVLDAKGKAIVVDQKRLNLKRGELDFTTMKTDVPIIGAWGVDPDDQVVMWNSSFYSVVTGNELKLRRKGSLGYRLLKGRKPYNLIVVPRDCFVLTDEGTRIKDYGKLHKTSGDLLIVAKKFNVVVVDDKKAQMSGMEIEIKFERGDSVDLVFPMV